ncbi:MULTISPECIES: single-stranded DNA-binding protein [Streptomyces]|uniref:Single-stranded DNA-binding protein n=1 Tax=Streptomyces tsukubensis (strain DSM 42081 / NBRC 108919 / NRRL 18488 / 9993) TaxID=1114943 RepID=A0A7G3UQZ1_STRT9|nr:MULTISPECIES: single-stranded DNA-binding protein [Streptomyces]AZK94116.1 single-stranded DNA-binding protein [Streptomyces tsukubensis]MYS63676.1 single-stranded DNA-binding protein [Streptomyces sp. SID5473]QKM71841.1 single-stranded DNA-binding protein [Streptomyces tsukubensis NRRL18488]TAI46255.1 single-stranded DNA-binding protein [Streptomyces tsukubensis]
MSETTVTLVGNAATGVEYRETVNGPVARFRMAVTPRRWDRLRSVWTDGPTSFYTVFAWRGLAANVSGSVSVGDPLLVHGRLRVREVERKGEEGGAEGAVGAVGPGGVREAGPGRMGDSGRRVFVDIDAIAVGHDLNRGTSAFRRSTRPVAGTDAPAAVS